MNTNQATTSHERAVTAASGWVMLPTLIVLFIGDVALILLAIKDGVETTGQPHIGLLIPSLLLLPILSVLLSGFFTLQPNEARVLVLFGDYKGTVRDSGFHWGNPFYSRVQLASKQPAGAGLRAMSHFKLSLRARNFNSERLKVNDKRGNPVEIAAVVVWRVQDTAQALFDVQDFENYVRVQSES